MLVISAKSGQLGNRLLLFANFIAFARENNLKVLNPAFDEYAEFFESTSKDFLARYPVPAFSIQGNNFLRKRYYSFNQKLAESGLFKTIAINREKPFNWIDSDIASQVTGGSIFFFQGWLFRDGWFVRDLEKLRKHSHEIRAYFTPLKKYQDNVYKLISIIKNSSDILIGVHIRQGDYEKHQNGRYFYSSEDYVKVMQFVQNLFINKKVGFLICSNFEQEKNLFNQFNYFFGNNHIIEDMYSLAQCDYIMGPPSSYTMWASFYGNKPLYMIRDVSRVPKIEDFVQFYELKGIFHGRDNWSESFWEWTQ